jgi:hypothetical protein
MKLIIKQHITPIAVGNNAEIIIHFTLPVSFLIVSNVVPQGKWNNEKTIVQTAVTKVQPLFTKIIFNASKLSYSTNIPVDIYDIKIIGITISFAGNPKINASNIVPSNPINLAIGFSAFIQ